jgi:hypothetical protein
MVRDVLELKQVKRLQGILKARYGSVLELQFLSDMGSGNTASKAPSVTEGALLIPIFSQDRFLAKATLPGLLNITDEDIETISDLVRIVLEPLMQKWVLDNYSLVGSDYATALSDDEHKVVPMFQDHLTADSVVVNTRSFSTPVINLVSRSGSQNAVRRAVDEIHELSRRWACVQFDQIELNLKSRYDIEALGSMTLVVNELRSVSAEARTALVKYLSVRRDSAELLEIPLVLIYSSYDLSKLVESGNLEPELRDIIQDSILEVDRLPLNPHLLRETLELLLEPEANL